MSLYAQITYIGNNLVGTQRWGQAQISIFDAATGLPANGNNCEVTYLQNINGVSNEYSVIIPGLSYPIYTGELSDSNPGSFFYTNFTIISLVPGSGGGVDPSADDLTIVSVVTMPETAIGADDGTLTINATSSFPAIQYSLDNSTWQSSNEFTGLVSGAGTAYVKDANGGALSQPFTVGLLSNVLVSEPTVDLGNGNLSRWNAVFNPILFKFQRKDYQVTGITNDGTGNLLVNVNADMSNVKVRNTITSTVAGVDPVTVSGDMVYINTAKYEGVFEVIGKTGGSLTLAATYTGDDTTGFINIDSLRPYYNIQLQITAISQLTGQFYTITVTAFPFSNGSASMNISSFLKSLLAVKDFSNYSLVNYRDMQLCASYTVEYAEIWTGNAPVWQSITRPYYVTFAARQLQQIGGGNLQEFVPYPLSFQPAKWLSDFQSPTYSPGFPFDLSFIFSEYMTGLNPFYTIILLDINKNQLSDQSVNNTYLLNQDGSFILNEDSSKFIIASQAVVGTPIVQQVGLNRLLVNFIPPPVCWYFSVQIQYISAGTTYNLTRQIICRIDENTPDRPVYMRWIGLTGSWNYYRFVYNQDISLDVQNATIIKNYVTDWANSETIEDVVNKNAAQKMAVYGENIPVSDIKGLQSMKYSPKVQILISSAPVKWQTVIVDSGSFKEFETYLDQYSFSLSFALPSINTQYQ